MRVYSGIVHLNRRNYLGVAFRLGAFILMRICVMIFLMFSRGWGPLFS